MVLLGGAYHAVRRAMEEDQDRPRPSPLPLWRLLVDEIGVLARRVGRWRVTWVLCVVFACTLAVELAFSDRTPGPVLDLALRVLGAAALTGVVLCGWAVVHALRSADRG